jgi:hypothetical protein
MAAASAEEFGLDSSGITFIPNFMKILPAVLALLHAYRQTSLEITTSRSWTLSGAIMLLGIQR